MDKSRGQGALETLVIIIIFVKIVFKLDEYYSRTISYTQLIIFTHFYSISTHFNNNNNNNSP